MFVHGFDVIIEYLIPRVLKKSIKEKAPSKGTTLSANNEELSKYVFSTILPTLDNPIHQSLVRVSFPPRSSTYLISETDKS